MDLKVLLLSALLLSLTQALYDENSPVFKLTEGNFKNSVLNSD